MGLKFKPGTINHRKSASDKAGPKGHKRKGAQTSAGFKGKMDLKNKPQEKGHYNPKSMAGKRSPVGSKSRPTGKAALARRKKK